MLLIALEGIDGAGKTTTAALLTKQLAERGYSVTSTNKRDTAVQNPFAQQQIQAVGERLWGVPHDARLSTVGSLHWVYLNAAYFAATHHALSSELPGQHVAVMDNWIYKLIARMASNGEFQLDEMLTMISPLPQPNVVIMLDVPPKVAVQRRDFSYAEHGLLAARHNTFESFQAVVRGNLLRMASYYDWDVIVPGDADADEVASEIVSIIERRFLA